MIARKQTSIKVDPQAWESAREIFKEYNLTLSDAINIFLNKVRLEGGMPFDIKVPSKQLKNAMNEADNNEASNHDSLSEKQKKLDNFYSGAGLSTGLIGDTSVQEIKANRSV